MGASGWQYFVPYDPDIAKALRQLREDVFKSDKYFSMLTKAEAIEDLEDQLLHIEDVGPDPDMQESARNDIQAQLKRLRALPEPSTIEERIKEVLVISAESGTGSILDIRGISTEPDFGMAAPLSQSELLNLFDTDKPTRSMVENHSFELMNLRHREQGTYIIVYKDGVPDEIYFTGFSGD
jgi:hypothetical protein